jgi:hypothetical protein
MLREKKALNVKLPIPSSGVWLNKSLRTDAHTKVRPGLYDRFINQYHVWLQDEDERQFETARLMLYHSSGASGGPLARLLRSKPDLTCGIAMTKIFDAPFGARVTMLFATIIRATQMLSQAGHDEDAR